MKIRFDAVYKESFDLLMFDVTAKLNELQVYICKYNANACSILLSLTKNYRDKLTLQSLHMECY